MDNQFIDESTVESNEESYEQSSDMSYDTSCEESSEDFWVEQEERRNRCQRPRWYTYTEFSSSEEDDGFAMDDDMLAENARLMYGGYMEEYAEEDQGSGSEDVDEDDFSYDSDVEYTEELDDEDEFEDEDWEDDWEDDWYWYEPMPSYARYEVPSGDACQYVRFRMYDNVAAREKRGRSMEVLGEDFRISCTGLECDGGEVIEEEVSEGSEGDDSDDAD